MTAALPVLAPLRAVYTSGNEHVRQDLLSSVLESRYLTTVSRLPRHVTTCCDTVVQYLYFNTVLNVLHSSCFCLPSRLNSCLFNQSMAMSAVSFLMTAFAELHHAAACVCQEVLCSLCSASCAHATSQKPFRALTSITLYKFETDGTTACKMASTCTHRCGACVCVYPVALPG